MTVDVTTMHPNKDCIMSLTSDKHCVEFVRRTFQRSFAQIGHSSSFTRCVLEYAPHAAKSVRPSTISVRLTCDCVGRPPQYDSDDDWHRLINGKPMGTRLDVMHAAPWHRNTATPRHRLRIDVPDVIRISASGRMIAAHATIASAPGQASWPSLS